MTKEQLVSLLKQFRELADDSLALEATELYPAWNGSAIVYNQGARVQLNGTLYKCIQSHTSQSDWTPTSAPSLWAKVLIPDPNVIPNWEQPDSTNPYMTGDKVVYNEVVYESTIDNNVWCPSDYPQGWQVVTK